MKIATQPSPELTHVAKLIEDIPIAMLTTVQDDEAISSRPMAVLAKPWFPEGPDSSNLALLKFIPDLADYWDGPSSRMVRAFGIIASTIAGKPIAMGEHGSHTGLSSSTPTAS